MTKPEDPVMVTGKVTFKDGQTVDFMLLHGEGGWHQWGNTETVLYRSVPLVEAMQDAAAEHLKDQAEEEEEGERP